MRLAIFGVLIAAMASGENTERQVFSFAHIQHKQDADEMGILIRSITDVQIKISDEDPPSTLTVNGTPDQVKEAAFIFAELDQEPEPGSRANTSWQRRRIINCGFNM